MKDQITINGPDGAFDAYIARPEGLPAPGVVVLQELSESSAACLEARVYKGETYMKVKAKVYVSEDPVGAKQ